MKPTRVMQACVLGAVFTLLSAQARSAITEYTSQSSFLASLRSAGSDSFDDLASGVELATPLARTAGAFHYIASAGPQGDFLTAGSGSDTWLSTNIGTDAITFSHFSSHTQALGGFFFGTDIAGNATPVASITVTATDSGGTVTRELLTPSTDSFLGFSSARGLSSVTVAVGDRPGVWTTVNNLTLAAAVPEPETYPLALVGLAFVVWGGASVHRRANGVRLERAAL